MTKTRETVMKDSRTRLIEAGENLFRRQGYQASGLKELSKEAQAPWGSMYHFFPDGKEQLGSEVLRYAAAFYAEGWDRLFAHFPDPIDAIIAAFTAEIRILEKSGFQHGCPVAGVTLDVASTHDMLRKSCAHAFDMWIDAIRRGLAGTGIDDRRAIDIAEFVLATLEGAILLSRANHDTAFLQRSADLMRIALPALLAGKSASKPKRARPTS